MTIDIASPPASVPKTTLTGLRQRIDAIVDAKDGAPPSMTREQFDELDDAAREAYDDARLQWFSNGFYVVNPIQRRMFSTVSALLRMHDPNTVGERGIVLTGPPHIGKTTALIRLARDIEARLRRANPDFRDQGVAPVVYIEMEPKASPKSIASSVLAFFGIPHNFKTATQHQLTAAAVDALRRHRTVLLIIDEVQMLKLDGKVGDDAINSLKTFMNDSGAICVFAGVDLTRGLSSRAAEQIMARCQVNEMVPMTGTDDDSRGRWRAVVEAFGKAMHLLDADPDHLAPYADVLLTLSNGKIGDLRGILSLSMFEAIDLRADHGIEAITGDTILGIGGIGVA